jgi:phosphate ABC transporter permease protein PstC/phosphate ABC transporter permease subunit PstA
LAGPATQSRDSEAKAATVGFDRPLLLSARQDFFGYIRGKAGRALLLGLTGVSVLAVALIFLFIVAHSIPFLTNEQPLLVTDVQFQWAWPPVSAQWVGWSQSADALRAIPAQLAAMFASRDWNPEAGQFGIIDMLVGTLLVTGGALLIAVPAGLMAAIFLSDIVGFRVRQVVKPIVETLAAIPSVAWGFFAIMVVAPWLQDVLGLDSGRNALNASMILAVMAIPTIVSVAEDSLTAVGRELREASYALGATRAETVLTVVLPAAHNGIIAAVMLGLMRAVGETMLVLMAAGNAIQTPTPWYDLTEGVRTITATIASEMGEAAEGSMTRRALFTLGLTLLMFTFVLNMVTEHFLRGIRLRASGSRSKRGMFTSKLSPAMKKAFAAIGVGSAGRGGRFIGRVRGGWGAIRGGAGALWRDIRFGLGQAWGAVTQPIRRGLDGVFTVLAWLSVGAVTLALLLVLGPILWRGGSAVAFRGTVEFREMQYKEYGRGSAEELAAEQAQVAAAREPVYAMLAQFRRGIDTEANEDRAKELYRELDDQLRARGLAREEVFEIRTEVAKPIRNELLKAYRTVDKAEALAHLQAVLAKEDTPRLAGTVVERYFDMAREYRQVVETVDLARREEYLEDLQQVQAAVIELFGPREERLVAEEKYGALRADATANALANLLYKVVWRDVPGQASREQVVVPRREIFRGTAIEELFPMVENNIDAMMHPRATFYWQYFIDPAPPGHFYGGVGKEVLGTLMLTLVAIVVALPLGVVAAGYLVEASSDNLLTRVVRTCVNTLAGVPSIVFGLFGLAFFVIWLMPRLGLESQRSILAGGLTLALLILPVIIRASEEAIRSVPASYREASLASGASPFRCFITVTLPAALPGILTGAILGISRAAGETAPIMFTAAVAYQKGFGWQLHEPGAALSFSAYHMAVGDRIAPMVPHQQYGMVATLVVLILVLNVFAIMLRGRLARRLRGQ